PGARALARLPDARFVAARPGALFWQAVRAVQSSLPKTAPALPLERLLRGSAPTPRRLHRDERIQSGQTPRVWLPARHGPFAVPSPGSLHHYPPSPSGAAPPAALFPVLGAPRKDQGPGRRDSDLSELYGGGSRGRGRGHARPRVATARSRHRSRSLPRRGER